MDELTTTVDIDASPNRVWQTLIDVERWPEWTASVRRIQRLEDRPLGPGSRVRTEQPKLRPATWTVTDWEPGVAFTWVSKSPGVTAVARHTVVAERERCRVTLGMRFAGPLAPIVGLLARGLTKRYMALEAAGLKQRSERPG